MGVDIGTTGVKVAIFDERGNLLTKPLPYREYNLYHREPHFSEIDPEELWSSVVTTIRESIERFRIDPSKIKGVAASVLGDAIMPLDKKGKPCYWSIQVFDSRAQAQARRWAEHFDPAKMRDITGQILSPNLSLYVLYKIEWLRENEPEIYRKARKFVGWEAYFNFKLTGQLIEDYSVASRTMMFDIRRKKWSRDILSLAHLDEDLLPDIKPSGEVVGAVTEEASKKTGLAQGTEVICGGHDQPCASLGAGLIDKGVLTVSTGTVECYSFVEDDFPGVQGFPIHVYVIPTKYFVFGVVLTAGIVLKWFRDNFAYEERLKAEKEGKDVYGILDSEASEAGIGAKGLLLYPYFMGKGTPSWDSNARGAVIGLTLAHGKKEFARSILESLAYELRWNIEEMKKSGIDIKEIRAIGGGAKSPLWLQIRSDVTGLNIKVPKMHNESAALGAAILASVGAGCYRDASEAIGHIFSISQEYHPSLDNKKAYDKVYNNYVKTGKRLSSFWSQTDYREDFSPAKPDFN